MFQTFTMRCISHAPKYGNGSPALGNDSLSHESKLLTTPLWIIIDLLHDGFNFDLQVTILKSSWWILGKVGINLGRNGFKLRYL